MFYKMGMSVTTLVATCKLLDDKTACSIEEVNKIKSIRAYASNTPSFRLLRYRRSTLFQRIIADISGLERRHKVTNESMQNQIK